MTNARWITRMFFRAAGCFLLLATTAAAQLTITAVVNAGRSPNIAQGALFVVSARGIGPAEIQQASFPLPTIEGLVGVTIQATVGGATVDAIMAYVAPNEAAAILPSLTPIGTGTIRVNRNIGAATAPIRVVAANFGFFTVRPGFPGPAVAFNVSGDDGSAAQNTGMQSAQPGQDVLISGTGLGAITSDETQSGVTDVPNTPIQVFVGVKPAAVVSAGRGHCEVLRRYQPQSNGFHALPRIRGGKHNRLCAGFRRTDTALRRGVGG